MRVDQVETFLKDFTAWASSQSTIQGVALVGSYARNTAKESSDVDLVILASHPEQLLQSAIWINLFGKVSRQQTEEFGVLTSIRVWYSDGREIEYGITNENWADIPLDPGTQRVISDGMRVLFERKPVLSKHQL